MFAQPNHRLLIERRRSANGWSEDAAHETTPIDDQPGVVAYQRRCKH
jgi:hypothetical protein